MKLFNLIFLLGLPVLGIAQSGTSQANAIVPTDFRIKPIATMAV